MRSCLFCQRGDPVRDLLRMNDFYLFVAAQFAFLNKHLAFATRNCLARNFTRWALAWPSTGGAVMATLELVAM